MNAKRIDKLNKFIVKALVKAVKAGTRIIELYEDLGNKVESLKKIIDTLNETISKVEKISAEDDDKADDDLKIEEV